MYNLYKVVEMQAQHGPDRLNKPRARSARPGPDQETNQRGTGEPDPQRPVGRWRSMILVDRNISRSEAATSKLGSWTKATG